MKKLTSQLLLFTLLSLLLTVTKVQAREITDIYGRQVEVPDNPQRVFFGESRLLFSLALVYEGDPSSRIAGWPTDMKFYDPQSWQAFTAKYPALARVPTTGAISFAQSNVEKILALKPDLAILPHYARQQPGRSELERQLELAKIPYIYVDFRVGQLKNSVPSLKILGTVFNSPQKTARFIAFYQRHLQAVADRVKQLQSTKPKVMIQLHLGKKEVCCITVAHGSLADLLAFSGGDNIATPYIKQVYGQMNPEAVIGADPDIYITTGTSSAEDCRGIQLGPQVNTEQAEASLRNRLSAEPLLSQMRAIKQGNAWSLWHNFYISPLHVVAVEVFAKILYPQEFRDVDPESTMRQIFKEFLDMPYQGVYWARLGKEY